MIPAAAYIRVSSEMQVDVGASLPSQLAAIKEYAARNGYDVLPEHVYSDEGISARTADRPRFQNMIAAAKRDKPPFKAIICYENSRFARSREDAVLFKALLRRRGIKLHFVKQDFDDTPAGRMMEGIIESVDQWYSENLAVETKRGQIQNTKDGYSTGGRPPYGLCRVEVKNEHGAVKAKWEPDPDTSKVVQRIYGMYCKGIGYKAIAQTLNAESISAPSGGMWNANTLHYILHKNQQAYLGRQIYGREKNKNDSGLEKYQPEDEWTVRENAWQAIITQDQADAAAKRSRTYLNAPRSRGVRQMDEGDLPRYLLTGKIICGECGSAMIGSASSHNHYYYRCNKQALQGKAACDMPLAHVLKVENTVIKAIKEHMTNRDILKGVFDDYIKSQTKNNVSDTAEETASLENALNRKGEERKRLVAAVMKGVITNDDARDFLRQIDIDSEKLKARIDELNFNKFPSKLAPEDFDDFCNTVQIAMGLETRESKKILIDSFVDQVKVYKDHLSVVLSVAVTGKNDEQENICLSLAERVGFEPT